MISRGWNGFEAVAVLNEDENTGNKQTATKINAPAERIPAMFKRCTIGRKYDSCNTDEFWRVSRCFFFEVVFFGKLAIFCLPNSFL